MRGRLFVRRSVRMVSCSVVVFSVHREWLKSILGGVRD